jgi:GT2 family glycosyltransferase
LREHGPRCGASVYVVDNASKDGTIELIRSEFPEVTVIANEHNMGFSAANNIAIRQGQGRYVLALNPDTRATPRALDAVIGVMDADPKVGICGCCLVREDGTFDHASKRSFPTIAGALGHFLRIGRRSRAPRLLAQYRAPDVEQGPVDAVNGAFMLMRRTALDEVGLFDESFWMYMEDLDLCYRFREAGWKTWYEPSVSFAHVKGGSSGPIRDPLLTFAFHYGMLRFYRKHYASAHSGATNGLVYTGIATKLALALIGTSFRRVATSLRGR